jgi:HEAT repeat protein
MAAAITLIVFAAGCGGRSDPPLQVQAIVIPAEAPNSIRQWAESLNSDDPLRRAHGAGQLGDMSEGREFAVPALLKTLRDGNHLVRSSAAESLGKLGDAQAATPLIEILKDTEEDRDVRARAAEALGRLEAREAVQPLIAALDDIVWRTRYQAIVALGRIGDPAAREALSNAAQYDPDYPTRIAAQEALRGLGTREE